MEMQNWIYLDFHGNDSFLQKCSTNNTSCYQQTFFHHSFMAQWCKLGWMRDLMWRSSEAEAEINLELSLSQRWLLLSGQHLLVLPGWVMRSW